MAEQQTDHLSEKAGKLAKLLSLEVPLDLLEGDHRGYPVEELELVPLLVEDQKFNIGTKLGLEQRESLIQGFEG